MGMDEECGDCVAEYRQAFETQPWKVLWWVDSRFHRAHKHFWLARKLCDLVDVQLWKVHN